MMEGHSGRVTSAQCLSPKEDNRAPHWGSLGGTSGEDEGGSKCSFSSPQKKESSWMGSESKVGEKGLSVGEEMSAETGNGSHTWVIKYINKYG